MRNYYLVLLVLRNLERSNYCVSKDNFDTNKTIIETEGSDNNFLYFAVLVSD